MSGQENTFRLSQIIQKARDNKKKIKGILRLKKKLERGEYIDLLIMNMLQEEDAHFPESSTLKSMNHRGVQ